MKITCRPDSKSVSGPNIGMQRGHTAAGLDQRVESRAQRRLQRTQIEDQAARRAAAPDTCSSSARRAKRRRQHDQVEIQRIALPVGNASKPGKPPLGSAMATRNP